MSSDRRGSDRSTRHDNDGADTHRSDRRYRDDSRERRKDSDRDRDYDRRDRDKDDRRHSSKKDDYRSERDDRDSHRDKEKDRHRRRSDSRDRDRDRDHDHRAKDDRRDKKDKKDKKEKKDKKDKDDHKYVGVTKSGVQFPRISTDDYFNKNVEFSLWLEKDQRTFFSQLKGDEARDYFKEFVRKWNAGRLGGTCTTLSRFSVLFPTPLSNKLVLMTLWTHCIIFRSILDTVYKGLDRQQLSAGSLAGHTWKFATNLSSQDKQMLDSIKDNVYDLSQSRYGEEGFGKDKPKQHKPTNRGRENQ